jgi:hypothetical protein
MAKNNSVKKERKSRIDRLLNFSKNSYFERTSRPLCAAAFLLPFIIFYEIGTILINTDVLRQSQIRVVAFVWLQDFLEYLGFASKFAWIAPPLAVLIILLSLQVVSRKPWKVLPKDLWKMALESIALALPLLQYGSGKHPPQSAARTGQSAFRQQRRTPAIRRMADYLLFAKYEPVESAWADLRGI